MKNCIIYLLRSSQEDIDMLNKSLGLLELNLLQFTRNCDVIIFHENDLYSLKGSIHSSIPLMFVEIDMKPPVYPEEISSKILEYFPHPTHGNGPVAYGHKGFTIGYRNMCRFFSGEFYKMEIIHNYEYYLRLDTDSYILTPLNYDIFEFAKQNDLIYGFCSPAIQVDNQKVVEGLNNFVKNYIEINSIKTFVNIDLIENGRMFYTNFELGKVSWFIQSKYLDFYKAIDESGNIYIKRWGDAPIKYLGVNLFCEPTKIIPVRGFTYQHGAVYNL